MAEQEDERSALWRDCQQVVAWLAAQRRWQLLGQQDWASRACAGLQAGVASSVPRAAVHAYVEALYQACRYPHHPAIQREILAQASPIAAKMKSKHAYALTRPDWEVVRVPIMAWCLRLKLAQHWEPMSQLLLATGRRPIVEASFRDQFWGAVAVDTERLVGANVLGCLLGALRDRVRQGADHELRLVTPPGIPDLCLLGRRVGEEAGGTVSSQRGAAARR